MAVRGRRGAVSGTGLDADTTSLFAHEFAERHFLVYHPSVSRLRRIKAHLLVHACVEADAASAKWTERNPPTPQQLKVALQPSRRRKASTAPTADMSTPGGFFAEPHPVVGTFNCEIRMITDPAHPAFRQFGLFATRKITGAQPIMPYAGLVGLSNSVPSSGAYLMTYSHDNSNLGIDAEFFGNSARFANDPRGTAAMPNVTAIVKTSRLGELYTCLQPKKGIAEGDEIILDYGKTHRLSGVAWNARSGRELTTDRPVRPASDLASVFHRGGGDEGEEAPSDKDIRAVWRCFQCGRWNDGGPLLHVPSAVAVRCAHCLQPKASETPTCVTVARQQPSSSHDADKGDGFRSMLPGPNTLCSPVYTGQRSAVQDLLVNRDIAAATTTTAPSNNSNQPQRPAAAANGGSSVPAEWPRQFPFVSWQIWDPEVPIVEINAKAKRPFAPQSSLGVSQATSGAGRRHSAQAHARNSSSSSGDDDEGDKGEPEEEGTQKPTAARPTAPRRRQRHSSADGAGSAASSQEMNRQCVFTKSAVQPNCEIAAVGGLLADVDCLFHEQAPNTLLRVYTRYLPRASSRPHLVVAAGGELDQPHPSPLIIARTTPAQMERRCKQRLRQAGGGGDDDDDEDDADDDGTFSDSEALNFDFFVTNEVRHIRIARECGSMATQGALPREALCNNPRASFIGGGVEPNVTLHWIRDPLGFQYIGLVSLREIEDWGELVL